MTQVAVIDVGTVTARLALAQVEGQRVVSLERASNIVNLGEGVDKSGVLKPEACKRLLSCVDEYLARIREAHIPLARTCCTLTSASRDARNSDELLQELAARGLTAQVIPGDVEGRLTFLGVAQDFPGTRLLVADNGGGSTEFVLGQLGDDGVPHLDFVRSIDVGCRRITEKFLSRSDPPTVQDILEAHRFASGAFAPVGAWWGPGADGKVAAPERLVVTGGTSTTIVALHKELVPYDSAQVHLCTIPRAVVGEQEYKLASLTLEQRAKLPGIQAKRAPVILGGVIAVADIMSATGFGELTVSESDLLYGLSLTVAAAVDGRPSPVDWVPEL